MTKRAINSQLFQPVRDVESIAAELGVTRQRVDAIIQSGLKKLRVALERKGVKTAREILPDD